MKPRDLTIVLRAFDYSGAPEDPSDLLDSALPQRLQATWEGSEFSRGLCFAGTGLRLRRVENWSQIRTMVAKEFPTQLYLSDERSLEVPNPGIRWTLGLRRGMVTVLIQATRDLAWVSGADDVLVDLNRRLTASIPGGSPSSFASSLEAPHELDEAGPLPEFGRLTAAALYDLIRPAAASTAIERSLVSAVEQQRLPKGCSARETDQGCLVRWIGDGEEPHVALRRRIEWFRTLNVS